MRQKKFNFSNIKKKLQFKIKIFKDTNLFKLIFKRLLQ